MKIKTIFNTFLFFFIGFSKNAAAEISYAGKFLSTTAAGCGFGMGVGFLIGEYGAYEGKSKQVVTFMSSAVGCLSSAIFSYFFYDDPSKEIAQRNEQLQYINDQLHLQLQAHVNSEFLKNQTRTINSILENMQIAKIDFGKNGGVESLKNGLKKCDVIYPLWMGKDGFVHSNTDDQFNEELWIPVSPYFALKTWQFYYSKDGCFEEDKKYGYFEDIMPGLSSQLENQLRYTIKIITEK